MILFISFFLWMVLSPEPEPGNIILGFLIALLSYYAARKLLPRGNFFKAFGKIIIAFPVAVVQAFSLLFKKEPKFTAWEKPCPDNRIAEFGEIISITMTPEEVVVLKDNDKLIIHGVKRK